MNTINQKLEEEAPISEETVDVLPTPRRGDPYSVEFPWQAEMDSGGMDLYTC